MAQRRWRVCSRGEAERGEPRRGWNTLRGKPQLSPLQGEDGMYIHGTTCIYFPSCSYLITFLFAMQVAEAQPGEVIHDVAVYEKMRLRKPDLSQPQPSLKEYFGNAQQDLQEYSTMVKSRHPHVDDPIHAETDEESLVLSSHGLQHGRLKILNKKVKPTLSTSFTRLRATHPADGHPIPPRSQPRRSRYDVSFPHFHHLYDFRSCMAKC